MDKINIYISKEQKQTLNVLKKTHQISWSTIIDLIVFHYYVNPFTREQMLIDTDIRQQKEMYYRTSIRIKNEYKLKAKQINNALQMYFLKMDKDPQNPDFYIQMRNNLNHSFQNAYDEWWNYNAFCHMKDRYNRENKQQWAHLKPSFIQLLD